MNILDVAVPPSPCLACGKMNDMAMGTTPDTRPSPGDFTICATCGHVMVFAADLTLRNPIGKEMVAMAGDIRLLKVQAARVMALKAKERK
jgi:hypothetical protein